MDMVLDESNAGKMLVVTPTEPLPKNAEFELVTGPGRFIPVILINNNFKNTYPSASCHIGTPSEEGPLLKTTTDTYDFKVTLIPSYSH